LYFKTARHCNKRKEEERRRKTEEEEEQKNSGLFKIGATVSFTTLELPGAHVPHEAVGTEEKKDLAWTSRSRGDSLAATSQNFPSLPLPGSPRDSFREKHSVFFFVGWL